MQRRNFAVWAYRCFIVGYKAWELFVGGGLATVLVVWWWFSGLHWGLQIVAIAAVVWVILSIVSIFAFPGFAWFEGYQNRDGLTSARGNLTQELRRAKTIYLSLTTGRTLQDSQFLTNPKITSKIRKLIIMSPDNPAIDVDASISKTVRKPNIVSDIEATVNAAMKAGIPTKYLIANLDLPSMVIVNHRKHFGWMRMVIPFSGIEAEERCSIVIKKNKNKPLFRRTKTAFNEIWCNENACVDVDKWKSRKPAGKLRQILTVLLSKEDDWL